MLAVWIYFASGMFLSMQRVGAWTFSSAALGHRRAAFRSAHYYPYIRRRGLRSSEGGSNYELSLEVAGAVERVVYRAPSGYTVAKIRAAAAVDPEAAPAAPEPSTKKKKRKQGALVTVVSSNCPLLATAVVGDMLSCRGAWTTNQKYGTQFVVQSSSSSLRSAGSGLSSSISQGGEVGASFDGDEPSPAEATLAWLKSGALPGVGPATATRIVELLGDRSQEVIDGLADCSSLELSKHELLRVPKLGPKLLSRMAEAVQGAGVGRRNVQRLCALGVPLEFALPVADYYGADAEENALKDWHATCLDLVFVGRSDPTGHPGKASLLSSSSLSPTSPLAFTKTDEVARRLGCPADAPGRLRHGVLATLMSLTESSGHCCAPLPLLVARAQVTLSCAAIPPRDPSSDPSKDRATGSTAAALEATELNELTDANAAEAAAWAQRGAYVPSLWEVAEVCAETCSRHFIRFEVLGAPTEPVMPLVAALAAAEAAEAATKGPSATCSASSSGSGNSAYVAVFLPSLFNAEEEVTAAVAQRCRPAAAVEGSKASGSMVGTSSGNSGSSTDLDNSMNGSRSRNPHNWQGWNAAAAAEMAATAEQVKASTYEKTLAKLTALDLYAGFDIGAATNNDSGKNSGSITSTRAPAAAPTSTSSSWAVASVQRDALLLHNLWQQRSLELKALDQVANQAAQAAKRASDLAEKAALDAASGLTAWPTSSSASPSSSSSLRTSSNSMNSFGSSSRAGRISANSIAGTAAAAPATRAAVAAAEASLAAQLEGTVKALNEVGASVSFPATSPSLSPLPSPSPIKGSTRTNVAGAIPSGSGTSSSVVKPPTTLASLGAAFAAAAETARLEEPSSADGGRNIVYPWEAKYPKGWLEEAKNDNSGIENANGGTSDKDLSTNNDLTSAPGEEDTGGTSNRITEPITALTVRHRLASLAASAQARWGGKRLSLAQAQAVALATDEKLLLVSGGPGVGKTETVRAIVHALADERGERVTLTCPTARAAQVLERVTGRPAVTIHRLLAWSPARSDFEVNAFKPLACDAVVVDEASMLDVELAAALFRALPKGARLILVGDQDQLPSVGPGSLYRDLMACQCVPRVVLHEVFRQAKDGSGAEHIALDSHRVNHGALPRHSRSSLLARRTSSSSSGSNGVSSSKDYDDEEGNGKMCSGGSLHAPNGVVQLSSNSASEAADQVLDAIETLVVAAGRAPEDIQVLSPIKRGPCGTIELNRRLQRLLNPQAAAQAAASTQNRQSSEVNTRESFTDRVYVGDRMLQLVNDYDQAVFNGDPGSVSTVFPNGSFVVDFEKTPAPNLASDPAGANHGASSSSSSLVSNRRSVQYRPSELNARVSLAYALTVHKAQGSEYPCVVVPLVRAHGSMLQRTVLYTAMSRASTLLVLVADSSVLATCAAAADPQRRLTNLPARVRLAVARGKETDSSIGTSTSGRTSSESAPQVKISGTKPVLEGHGDESNVKEEKSATVPLPASDFPDVPF